MNPPCLGFVCVDWTQWEKCDFESDVFEKRKEKKDGLI